MPNLKSWLPWLTGIAIFGAVVVAVLRISDVTTFITLIQRIEWYSLLAAALAQALTYYSESQVWRSVTVAAGAPVSLTTAYQLSIAKLFVDQAVPTGGLSGTLVYVEGLRRAGIARRVAISGVVVDTFSYYAAYAVCIAIALVIAAAQEALTAPLAAIAVVFAIGSTAFALIVLMQPGLRYGALRTALERRAFLGRALRLLQEIDATLCHDPRLLRRAVAWQMSIQILDAATLWLLLMALGATVEPATVFISYMFSALFRTLSFSPGGLGTYEAASVLILRSVGVPVEVAFSSTVLFRGLNFWLPMLPGMWFARRVMRSQGPFSTRFRSAEAQALPRQQ